MRRLLEFLFKYYHWLLFIALEVASLILVFRYNNYQQSFIFTTTGEVVGRVYEIEGWVNSYLNLRETNEELLNRNTQLERKLGYYEERISNLLTDSLSNKETAGELFTSFPARVINNSLNKQDNFFTLNKGRAQGIEPDMGIIDGQGVVGIVYKVSPNYALAISLLNSKMNLSCKVKGTEYFGYLNWEGGDSRIASMKDLPRHAEFTLGDTIVTSGFSTVFPEGLMVGTVDDITDSNDGLSFVLKVKLSANLAALTQVQVIATRNKLEREELEANENLLVK